MSQMNKPTSKKRVPPVAPIKEPKTLAERLIARRTELGLTQDNVASQVIFTPRSGVREGDKVVLSRNAYAMYETSGTVEPDLAKIIAIAKVLDVSPQWLAFGVGERKALDCFSYNAQKNQFVKHEKWAVLPEEWLTDVFGVEPAEVDLFIMSDFQGAFRPGEVAIVKRGDEPSASGGEFIFLDDGSLRIAHLTRNRTTNRIQIFAPDAKTHEERPMSKIQVIGRVIGKIGSITPRLG